MSYDPMSRVIDAPILVSPQMLGALRTLRAQERFESPVRCFGILQADEKQLLTELFGAALDSIIAGLAQNPGNAGC